MTSQSEIEVKIEGEKGYILLGGTLSTKDTRDMRKAFEKLDRNNIREIYVNMSNVHQVDSSGVGILVMYLKKMREQKGDLKLMFPREEVKRILRLVNLYSYFDIVE